MANLDTLRRLALKLPEVEDTSALDGPMFRVACKGLVWPYRARAAPKTPRVIQPGKVAIRCPLERKEMLIAAAPDRFFDDDHFSGYPAVLVHLDAIDEDELAHLLYQAWRMQAPKSVQKRHTL